jgi:hypothetical protein
MMHILVQLRVLMKLGARTYSTSLDEWHWTREHSRRCSRGRKQMRMTDKGML